MALGLRISSASGLDIFGPLLAVHMLVMVAVGGYFAFKSGNLVVNGEAAHATVVEMKRGSRGTATPVVEFTTASGQRIRMKGIASSSPPAYHVGEQVTVLYLPSDPSVNAIQSFTEMWIMPTVFIPVGLGGTTGGVAMWIYGVRRKRDRARLHATGWHVQGVVVGIKDVSSRKTPGFEAQVELRDPRSGEVLRVDGERRRTPPVIGRPAMVHVDSSPPHGYIVELG